MMLNATETQFCETACDPTAGLNYTSAVASARAVIQLALSAAKRPIVTTKFGPYSAVLLHLLTEEVPDIPVVWIDTGFNTRATMQFADDLQDLLKLNLHVFQPVEPWRGFVPEIEDVVHSEFTTQVKLEPFGRALDTLVPDMWFSSLRRDQTDHRNTQPYFDQSHDTLLKACPLIHWNDHDMQAYLDANALTSEHDYDDPTKGNVRRECGLHQKF